MKDLKDYVRTIPNFPEEGIMFRDITSVLQDPEGFKLAIDKMQDMVKDLDFDVVLGAESRGFIFSAPIAYNRGKALVPVRKKGKLPCETIEVEYDLEYGTDRIEIHKDAIEKGKRVLVIDDLLATGGTAAAACELVQKAGCLAGIAFVIELEDLKGREKLPKDVKVVTLAKY